MNTCFQQVMVATAAMLFTGSASAADSFPSRPIHIIVATAAGGSSDAAARVLAAAMEPELGAKAIVENKVGASGTIAASFVAKSNPDGYTILLGTGSTQVLAPTMMKNVPYDPQRDFVPIAMIGRAPFVLFAGPTIKAQTLPELVAAARARPGELTFGTTGPSTVYELSALALEAAAGVRFQHVPYAGLVPMRVDVSAGVVDLGVGPVDGGMKSDRLHIIAVLGSKHVDAFPGVASAGDAGYPGFDVPAWTALFAPSGTPRLVVQRLMDAVRAAMSRQDTRVKLESIGFDVENGDDASLARTVDTELNELRALMKRQGVAPQ